MRGSAESNFLILMVGVLLLLAFLCAMLMRAGEDRPVGETVQETMP